MAAGHIFVGSDYVAQQIGGRMWWKTWSDPVEFARVDTLLADGAYDDSWVIDSDLDRELHDWADGRFQFHGTSYELIWLDDAESTRVRSEVFDHEVS